MTQPVLHFLATCSRATFATPHALQNSILLAVGLFAFAMFGLGSPGVKAREQLGTLPANAQVDSWTSTSLGKIHLPATLGARQKLGGIGDIRYLRDENGNAPTYHPKVHILAQNSSGKLQQFPEFYGLTPERKIRIFFEGNLGISTHPDLSVRAATAANPLYNPDSLQWRAASSLPTYGVGFGIRVSDLFNLSVNLQLSDLKRKVPFPIILNVRDDEGFLPADPMALPPTLPDGTPAPPATSPAPAPDPTLSLERYEFEVGVRPKTENGTIAAYGAMSFGFARLKLQREAHSDNATGLSYGVEGGVALSPSPTFSILVGYRFAGTEKLKFRELLANTVALPPLSQSFETSITEHMFRVRVRAFF